MWIITEKGSRVLKEELTTTYPSAWVAILEILDDYPPGDSLLERRDRPALKEMKELGLVDFKK